MEATTLAGIFATLASECDQSRMRALCGRAGDADWPHDAAWTEWLLMLSAEDVAAAERLGLHRVQHLVSSMPPTLRSLCGAVNAASSALGRDANGAPDCAGSCVWRQSPEKAEQVRSMLAAVGERCNLRSVRRVVDVGCGKGHLTAALRRALGIPALGIDADAELLSAARDLYPEVGFEARDLVKAGLECAPGDLVVGLHPCGIMGEAVVSAVCGRAAGSTEGATRPQMAGVSLLMVPCCWHKQGVPIREPLSSAGVDAGVRLPQAALKKACMALDSAASVAPRRARHELRELLRLRGVDEVTLASRREMDGIQPRKARRGLAAIASDALHARGMEPPSEMELAEASRRAFDSFERDRKLSLLEPVFGELIELLCTLDRALALQEAGLHASVFRGFSAGASSRNLCILAEGDQVAAPTDDDRASSRSQLCKTCDDVCIEDTEAAAIPIE